MLFKFLQDDYTDQAIKAMKEDLLDKKFKLNVEYRVGGQVTDFAYKIL